MYGEAVSRGPSDYWWFDVGLPYASPGDATIPEYAWEGARKMMAVVLELISMLCYLTRQDVVLSFIEDETVPRLNLIKRTDPAEATVCVICNLRDKEGKVEVKKAQLPPEKVSHFLCIMVLNMTY